VFFLHQKIISMARIQIITIIINFIFIGYISRLIVKGKLREEYAVVWIVITFFLVLFSFWRDGLDFFSKLFGVAEPPNLVFTAFIFLIMIYLLHLSQVSSKMQKSITKLTQEIALMKESAEKNTKN
jgi:hypothetical protein